MVREISRLSSTAKPKKAGHRSWAPRGQKVAGRHNGDIMSPEKRSRLMARIRGVGTKPERLLAEALEAYGICFDRNVAALPGRPDLVFASARVAVFVDGDFWHGWRFPLWRHKMSPSWVAKIGRNRERDRSNHRRLRRLGWRVQRIWEHQVEKSPERCLQRILTLVGPGRVKGRRRLRPAQDSKTS